MFTAYAVCIVSLGPFCDCGVIIILEGLLKLRRGYIWLLVIHLLRLVGGSSGYQGAGACSLLGHLDRKNLFLVAFYPTNIHCCSDLVDRIQTNRKGSYVFAMNIRGPFSCKILFYFFYFQCFAPATEHYISGVDTGVYWYIRPEFRNNGCLWLVWINKVILYNGICPEAQNSK